MPTRMAPEIMACTADMDISVPASAAVDIASKRGDVTVNDRKANVKVSVQHGDVTLNGDRRARTGQSGKGLAPRLARSPATLMSPATSIA